MTNEVVRVPFHGTELLAIAGAKPAETMVVLKPIVEGMGLDWEAQHKKVNAHPVLKEGISVMEIPSAGGPQKATCLPLRLTNFWLATVSTKRIADAAVREKIVGYQRECADVLYRHFRDKAAGHEGAAPLPTLDALRDPDILLPLLGDYGRRVKALTVENTALVAQNATLTAKAEVLEVQNGRLAPRAAALDRIAAAAGALCVTATAKVLKVGPKSLFQRLHRMRWLYRRPGSRVWLGRENVVRAGFLTHDSRLIKRGDGTERVVEQVKVTAKGLARLAGLLNQGALRLKGPA